jgi:hypothetical protein
MIRYTLAFLIALAIGGCSAHQPTAAQRQAQDLRDDSAKPAGNYITPAEAGGYTNPNDPGSYPPGYGDSNWDWN